MDRIHKNFANSTEEEIQKERMTKAIISVIVGTIIYSVAVAWIFELGQYFAGGVTGISQFIIRLIYEFTGKQVSIGILVFLLNFPLFLIGFKHVSHKFAILTLISIAMQSLTIFVVEKIPYNPFIAIQGDRLLLTLLGGIIAGLGCAICLKAGGSTGGVDIISNILLVKKNKPFAAYSLAIDIVIMILAGLNITKTGIDFNFATSMYTLVRLIIYFYTIDQFYTIYRPMKISIITSKGDEMCKVLLSKIHHGITMHKAIGAYTKNEREVLEIYASSFEINDYIDLVKSIDPNAFIASAPVSLIKGNYIKKTII